MTYAEALCEGEDRLRGICPEARLNAWYLFSHCFCMERSEYFLRSAEEAPDIEKNFFWDCLKKRTERIPLEYILHETEFMGLTFYVDEHVLIPRQDTECLVEEVLKISAGKDVLDLCTGSGCIGISLAVLGKCRSVTLSDISKAALQVAERNALSNEAEVSLICSDLFADIHGQYDIITANPPYISTGELGELMPEVRDHEPSVALDGGEDGLDFYRRMIPKSLFFLQEKGRIYFEIGCFQGQAVKAMMAEGFEQVEVKKDLAGLDRIVTGIKREC